MARFLCKEASYRKWCAEESWKKNQSVIGVWEYEQESVCEHPVGDVRERKHSLRGNGEP